MELAVATEDAQQSRLELRVARAELARSKAQQAAVRHLIKFSLTHCGWIRLQLFGHVQWLRTCTAWGVFYLHN